MNMTLAEAILADSQGKKVEFKKLGSDSWRKDFKKLTWDYPTENGIWEFRLVPTPTYVPFTQATFPKGQWIKDKADFCEYLPCVTGLNGVFLRDVLVSWYYLLECYTFLDGSPCGTLAND